MARDAGTTRRSRGDREARRSARRTPAGFDAHGLRNALGPSTILDEEQVELIHAASLDLLQDVGIELMGPAARAAFRTAGAIVDDASGLVRVPREAVEQAVASAPSRFTVTPRNPRRALDVGGDAVAFGLVAGPPTVHDRVRGRRSGNLDDYVTLLKLAQSFDVIHFVGNQPTSPIELPANTRHLDCYLANVTYTDRTYHCLAIGRERTLDGIEMMAISRGLTREQVIDDPCVLTIISVNSPRRFDEAMTRRADDDGGARPAGRDHAVHADGRDDARHARSGARPAERRGSRGYHPHPTRAPRLPRRLRRVHVQRRPPERRAGVRHAGERPGHDRRRPTRPTLRPSLPREQLRAPSNALDAQAAYESEMSFWSAIVGGANLVYHGAGWMEGGLTASFEKVVLDVEMLQMMARTIAPVNVTPAEIAAGVEAIAEVQTGGHFFGSPHTLSRYETAFYEPLVSDWQSYENWEAAGAHTADQRAPPSSGSARSSSYAEPPLEPAIAEALDEFVVRRKEELRGIDL